MTVRERELGLGWVVELVLALCGSVQRDREGVHCKAEASWRIGVC